MTHKQKIFVTFFKNTLYQYKIKLLMDTFNFISFFLQFCEPHLSAIESNILFHLGVGNRTKIERKFLLWIVYKPQKIN